MAAVAWHHAPLRIAKAGKPHNVCETCQSYVFWNNGRKVMYYSFEKACGSFPDLWYGYTLKYACFPWFFTLTCSWQCRVFAATDGKKRSKSKTRAFTIRSPPPARLHFSDSKSHQWYWGEKCHIVHLLPQCFATSLKDEMTERPNRSRMRRSDQWLQHQTCLRYTADVLQLFVVNCQYSQPGHRRPFLSFKRIVSLFLCPDVLKSSPCCHHVYLTLPIDLSPILAHVKAELNGTCVLYPSFFINMELVISWIMAEIEVEAFKLKWAIGFQSSSRGCQMNFDSCSMAIKARHFIHQMVINIKDNGLQDSIQPRLNTLIGLPQ